MSSFYQLMMRKKEEIMYATIKGTLTENDGVFSGFSSSNYLQIQNTIDINSSTNFEMVVKVNFNNFTDTSTFVGSFNRYDITLRTGTDGKVYFNVGNGNSWIIVNLSSTNTFLLNTDYYFKIVLKSNTAQVFSSTNGTSWTQEINKELIIADQYNFKITLGIGRVSSTYFDGSIDLNQSYIKLGSTKYNLQAVVGYTVVGSPTITDGVVSGFSGSNYINIPYSFPFLSSNNWKIIIRATTTKNENTQQRILNGGFVRVLGNNIQWSLFVSGDNFVNDIGSITEYPYFKIERKENTIYLSSSADGITYTNNKTTDLTDLSDSSYIRYGNASSQSWTGQLFIKDCLIYKDGKLWFNGQQA